MASFSNRSNAQLRIREDVFDATTSAAFTQSGLFDIAEKLRDGMAISRDELEVLVERASFPILLRMIELCDLAARNVVMRPLFYLPAAELLEARGVRDGSAAIWERISSLDADLEPGTPIHIAIDRWVGVFGFEQVLDVVKDLLATEELRADYRVIGPSTAEITSIVEFSENTGGSVRGAEEILREMKSRGISSLSGGTNLSLHSLAAERGFEVNIGVEILRDDKVLAIVDPTSRSTPAAFREDFLAKLIFIRDELLPTTRVMSWFPWIPTVLDRMPAGSEMPLGEQLLRALAVARLMLRDIPYIQVPMALLGPVLPSIATALGANDFGYVAVDRATQQQLEIPRLSEVRDIFGDHSDIAPPRMI